MLLAEGSLPHGPAGAASLRERQVEIGRFTRQLEEAGLILEPGKAVDVDMELGDFKIRGQLTRFAAETQLCLRPVTVGRFSAGMAPPFALARTTRRQRGKHRRGWISQR